MAQYKFKHLGDITIGHISWFYILKGMFHEDWKRVQICKTKETKRSSNYPSYYSNCTHNPS